MALLLLRKTLTMVDRLEKINPDKKKTGRQRGRCSFGQKPILLVTANLFSIALIWSVMIDLGLNNLGQKKRTKVFMYLSQENLEHKNINQNPVRELISLETFFVNLSGSKGRQLMKINMELQVEQKQVLSEIKKLKPKIRDIITVILSTRTYPQVSTEVGQSNLQEEN